MAAHDELDTQVTKVASLGDPIRRALYRYVVAQPDAVNREQAAAGVGIAHHTAKFHLDKLEEEGLLDVEHRRPPGRTGPGAGRPAKYYRRSPDEVAVSLPERHYDLAGRVMAEAITSAATRGIPVSDALPVAAREAGRGLGERASKTLGPAPDEASVLAAVAETLADTGYEPRVDDTGITLANCPFHSLAADYTDLVCGLNLHLIDGVLECMNHSTLRAQLDPHPDRCCVTVHTA
jgi:predicted ArsR family transcriptional regulator